MDSGAEYNNKDVKQSKNDVQESSKIKGELSASGVDQEVSNNETQEAKHLKQGTQIKDKRRFMLSIIFMCLGALILGLGFINEIRKDVFVLAEIMWCGGLILIILGFWLLYRYYRPAKSKKEQNKINEVVIDTLEMKDKI